MDGLAILSVEQWGLIVAVAVALGLDGKNGWRFLRWIGRGFKPAPVTPQPVIIHNPLLPPPPPPTQIRIGLTPGRPVIGREVELTQLHKTLLASGEVAAPNAGTVLRGQGGVGKSTLARHYAETHGTSYNGILWTNAATRQALIEGLAALSGPLGLPIP